MGSPEMMKSLHVFLQEALENVGEQEQVVSLFDIMTALTHTVPSNLWGPAQTVPVTNHTTTAQHNSTRGGPAHREYDTKFVDSVTRQPPKEKSKGGRKKINITHRL
eukprot:TRINITY_DN1239_c0_g1_i1.p2 TRINITY_DN1239_c0_g1~~TRINITY_DN1239_c0_g1_i1.p2  ORF type:complete len:106 (+),score=13.18 TRINITY_DN1239_c0_g1_i1:72-389(+)